MRLLVVRCLACAVVQAETMARGRLGGSSGVNAGTRASLCSAGRAESIFKATAGLSVCVSTVSVQSVRGRVRFAVARIRFVRGLGKAKCQPFVRARFVQRCLHRRI